MKVEKILEKIVSIPSPYPFENEIVEWVKDFLKKHDFQVKLIPVEGRNNIVAIKGNSNEKPLLLFGHLDTVPIQGVEEYNPHKENDRAKIVNRAIELGWKVDPYKPRFEKNKMIGSGAIDMKAGIATILYVASKLPEVWFESNKIMLAFSVAEEHLSQGAYELIKSGILKEAAACISTEILDTQERLTISNEDELPGVETFLIGRRGRIAIEVIVKGKTAHAATPQLGKNAIELAAKIVEYVKEAINSGRLKLREHNILPKASITPLSINAGTSSLSVPALCSILFDRHMVPPETPELVLNEFVNILNELKPEIEFEVKLAYRPVPFLLPFVTDPKERIVIITKEVIESIKGEGKVIISGGNSVADENMISSKDYKEPILHAIPTVIIGCKGGNYHSEEEWVDINSLKEMEQVLSNICLKWANNS